MTTIFRQAMELGYYFYKAINENEDIRVEDWTGPEDCATFAKVMIDYAEENDLDISFAFQDIADDIIDNLCDTTIPVIDHGYDDYCRGFLAGEIIGYPTEENLALIKEAELRWKAGDSGYYQDILNDIYSENINKIQR